MLKTTVFLGSALGGLAASYQVMAAILPGEIQDCVSSLGCSTPALVQEAPMFSAYSYLDGETPKFLFEYSLSASSNESTHFAVTQLSGAAWLSANAHYDLTQERHFFTLYLDGVRPAPTNLWLNDSDGLSLELSLTTADLLAGGGFLREILLGFGGDIVSEGDLETHGDMGSPGLAFCLDVTCEVGAQLNLLYLQYSQIGSTAELSINEADQRRLLYSQFQDYEFDEGWYTSQSYSVVPTPSATWLFGTGLTGLLCTFRRKKTL